MRTFLFMAFLVIYYQAFAQDPWKDIYKESAWNDRDRWQKPDEIINLLKLQAGDKVADVGSHEGYFTMKLSDKVGEKGKVYAVDISRDKLDKLNNHLAKRKIQNVRTVHGEADNPKLPTAALNAVLIVDTYHEMNHYREMLQHIKMALIPGGCLVICEPIADERKKLSRAEQKKKHELSIHFALDDLKEAGFRIIHHEENFIDRKKEKGDMMWIIVAEK